MDIPRIAAAAAQPPRLEPSPRVAATRQRQIEPAAIVEIRSHHDRGWSAARGGHAIQEAGNPDAVSDQGLQRIRGVLQRGFDSMAGGHGIQQATYEPRVSDAELTQRIRTIASNNNSFAGGSEVQHETQAPRHADRFGPKARQLAEKVASRIAEGKPELRLMQAARIERGATERILG